MSQGSKHGEGIFLVLSMPNARKEMCLLERKKALFPGYLFSTACGESIEATFSDDAYAISFTQPPTLFFTLSD